MQFDVAQREIAAANIGGAPGVLVSGLVWLVSGLIWLRVDVGTAFAALFVGGMLIVPASLLIARLFSCAEGSTGKPTQSARAGKHLLSLCGYLDRLRASACRSRIRFPDDGDSDWCPLLHFSDALWPTSLLDTGGIDRRSGYSRYFGLDIMVWQLGFRGRRCRIGVRHHLVCALARPRDYSLRTT